MKNEAADVLYFLSEQCPQTLTTTDTYGDETEVSRALVLYNYTIKTTTNVGTILGCKKQTARPSQWVGPLVAVHGSIVCPHVDQLYGHNELHKHLSAHKTSGLWLLI